MVKLKRPRVLHPSVSSLRSTLLVVFLSSSFHPPISSSDLDHVAVPEPTARGTVSRSIRSYNSHTNNTLILSKQWRRDHPFGFFAKPVRTATGAFDLKRWECGIPGKDKTLWEGGLFKLDVTFPDGELRWSLIA